MTSFSDDLARASAQADEVKYAPHTEFDGVQGHIQTRGLEEPPEDFTALLEQFGYDPTKVRIIGNPRTSRWQTYDERWLTAYRFNIAPVQSIASFPEIEAIISKAKGSPKPGSGPHWFVFQAGDTQIGKRSRDGATEEIIERYVQSVDAAKQEFKTLKRHGIEGIQISLPGDCIEGGVSQSGRNAWLTQETVTEQTRIMRRLMMYTVEQFSPLVDQVYLDVVNGNHDQQTRQWNTYPGDGWATETAIALDDALKLNPTTFGHVTVRVPDKWSGFMTVPVGDTVVCVLHGHQCRQRTKVLDWLAQQAVHNQAPGAAQVVQFGHFHTVHMEMHSSKTLVSSPTFDCGSDHYREKHGAESLRGALVYLMRTGAISRISLV